jgi:hemoglobin
MLKTSEYHGNAYSKHVIVGNATGITEEHFTRWLILFKKESDQCLSPQNASAIVKRASLIANSLRKAMLKNIS